MIDRKKNILYAAGLYTEGKTIEQMFAPIETKVVELATGKFVPETNIQPESYQQLKAALSDDTGRKLTCRRGHSPDCAVWKNILWSTWSKTVIQINQIILPVRGKGLWSTMYAYVALDGDLTTIRGVSFYQHGETPGLGGEVENRNWLKGWQGKEVYNEERRRGSAIRQRPSSRRQRSRTAPDRRPVGRNTHHQRRRQPYGILVWGTRF